VSHLPWIERCLGVAIWRTLLVLHLSISALLYPAIKARDALAAMAVWARALIGRRGE